MDRFGSSDVAALFSDAPVTVVVGAESTLGWVDEGDRLQIDDATEAQYRRTSVVVRTGAITGAAVGSTVTLDGTSYVIRDIIVLPPDGATTRWVVV